MIRAARMGSNLSCLSVPARTWGATGVLADDVPRASTLFGEPFADVKPQEIGVPMINGALNPPRPPPGPIGMVSRQSTAWPFLEEGDFAPTEIERMAHACLQSLEAALLQIEHWRQGGQGLEDIYIHGLAPSARLLGHWWRCDIADFAQVTIGSSNLQRVLHRLSPEFCAPGADQPKGLSLLLATEPQSQHTMGAFMLAEFFRRRGWAVQMLTPHDGEDVLTHLRRDWFDAVALSISSERQLQSLARWLPGLRAASPNPQLHVLVGGPLALNDPQRLQAMGIEVSAGNARETVNWLSQQVMHLKS